MEPNKNVSAVLQKYTSIGEVHSVQKVEHDFEQVAKQAPKDELTHGLSEAFRSDQTPSFGQMVGEVFGQGNPEQRAGMLNLLLEGVGAKVLNSANSRSLLAGMVQQHVIGRASVTPEQAASLEKEKVEQIADEAEKENPAVVEMISHFYAQNPTLAKPLGGAALSIVMDKIAQRRQDGSSWISAD
jgi:hypothetical protein